MLSVTSEVGRLRKVLIHEPGLEIDRMVPAMMEELLFDACGDEDAETRAIAAGSLSRYSDQRLRSGDRDGALRLLHRIVDAGADPALLREAIAHLGRWRLPVQQPGRMVYGLPQHSIKTIRGVTNA